MSKSSEQELPVNDIADRILSRQLYRVDWDHENESGELIHSYTFLLLQEGQIQQASTEWHPSAKNLTFRYISRTVEEDAYRAGLQDGYDAALREINPDFNKPVQGNNPLQTTIF